MPIATTKRTASSSSRFIGTPECPRARTTSGAAASLEDRAEPIAIGMVFRGFQAERQAVGARRDAIHAKQSAARYHAEQLRIGRRRIHHLDECVRARRVDALRFERGA